LASERILLVEDEGIVVLHIKKTLERLGYEVAGIASTGEDAIMKAMETRPDLVLMDIVLNGTVDGIDAAEKIRALFTIPVIYLSAHADEMTLQRAKVTEPFGYIVKPFKERDLAISIEFALYKAKAEAERAALLQELRDALSRVKTLSGLLPICASCKKIRNDEGYWNQIEVFLREHSGVEFSHSICPDCAKKLYPDWEDESQPDS
jgi:CheY-like chemotaxis protein